MKSENDNEDNSKNHVETPTVIEAITQTHSVLPDIITNKKTYEQRKYTVTVADLEPRQTNYRSANAKTYRIEYVLSIGTNDNLIATFNC